MRQQFHEQFEVSCRPQRAATLLLALFLLFQSVAWAHDAQHAAGDPSERCAVCVQLESSDLLPLEPQSAVVPEWQDSLGQPAAGPARAELAWRHGKPRAPPVS